MVLSGVGYTVGLAGRSHPTCLNVRGRGQLCRPAGRRAVSTAAATRYDVSWMVLMAIGDDRRRWGRTSAIALGTGDLIL